MFLAKFFFSVVFILVSVAFFTLFERKVLGLSHVRVGPNKLLLVGLFQPFSDALKLFSSEDLKLKELMFSLYLFSPIFYLFLMVLLWGIFPFWGLVFFTNYSIVIFICMVGVGVYFLLFSGWSSGSNFSLLGSFRSSSQSISYEVVMVFSLLLFVYLWFFLGFYSLMFFNFFMGVYFVSFICLFCWFMSCLAECNRSPFDFSEGESELVSGFNLEYGGGLFSFIFIGEYSSIIVLSFFTAMFFLGSSYIFYFFLVFSFLFVWVRSSFPRLRYDLLMMMAWKGLFFFVLSSFFVLLIYF